MRKGRQTGRTTETVSSNTVRTLKATASDGDNRCARFPLYADDHRENYELAVRKMDKSLSDPHRDEVSDAMDCSGSALAERWQLKTHLLRLPAIESFGVPYGGYWAHPMPVSIVCLTQIIDSVIAP